MHQMIPNVIHIYADGACSGNPGPGGWGYVMIYNGKTKEASGSDPNTTNNRMELTAVIKALEAIKTPSKIIITTDSNYVVKGMKEWIHGWMRNGWRTSQNKPVLNKELWLRLIELASRHDIQWLWIKGHDGHPYNERADKLATSAIKKA